MYRKIYLKSNIKVMQCVIGRDNSRHHKKVWLEKFGHLAAESWGRFNKDGADYGGNCRFRVHSKDFAVGIDKDSSSPCGLSDELVFNTRSYESIDDPGNRDDCDRQIARMNQIIAGEPRYIIGIPVKTNSHSFQLNSVSNYERDRSKE